MSMMTERWDFDEQCELPDKPQYETKIGYMCGTDFRHELDKDNPHSVAVFSSLENLKKRKPCWNQCGVVALTMKATWIVQEDFDNIGEDE